MNSQPERPSPTATSQTSMESATSLTESSSSESPGNTPSPARPAPHGILNFFMFQQLPLQNETTFFILVNVLDIVMTNLLLRWRTI